MWHTQTLTVSSSPRIRRRVASASALNRRFQLDDLPVHIYALTNISWPATVFNIRVSIYKAPREDVMADTQVHQAVREKYGEIARSGGRKPDVVGRPPADAAIRSPPTSTQTRKQPDFPPRPVAVSLGCGNPTALAQLEPGQTVLDLGSGGGIDVLLSAKRVGPTGKVYRPGHDRRDAGARAREPAASAARRTSSSSRARSSRFRCPTLPWTSSSRTASSICRPTRTRCCAKRSAC